MKISFSLQNQNKNIDNPEPFEVSYWKEGDICSVIIANNLKYPKISVDASNDLFQSLQSIQSKFIFLLKISWSKDNGFRFQQYSNPEITTSLISNKVNSLMTNIGQLRGGDKIEVKDSRDNWVTITFKAEVNQRDLEGCDQKFFLEKCGQFSIRLVDAKISNLPISDGLTCQNCQFINVEFDTVTLENSDFSNAYLSQVKFLNSNLNQSSFENARFCNVEFNNTQVRNSQFDNCRAFGSKSLIENNEILVFKNDCDLTSSSFVKATLCSEFEDCNLSQVDFSEAKLVACQFKGCYLSETNFSNSQFRYINTQARNNKKQQPQLNHDDLIKCCILPKTPSISEEKDSYIATISKCNFNGASMTYVDLSSNIIEESNFEGADLSNSILLDCKFIKTNFTSKTRKLTNLRFANISGSLFEECHINEVNLFRTKMIKAIFKKSDLVRANFYAANLMRSQFLHSDLTGVDFRYADLTLVNLHECILNCANFFQTQRGGINLNISIVNDEINDKNELEKGQNSVKAFYKSSCTISCIDWSPERDGEIQIDEQSFLSIVTGIKSAISVIENLSKVGADYIINNYNHSSSNPTVKHSGGDLTDTSTNIEGDVDSSSVTGGSYENNYDTDNEQAEDKEQEDNEDFADEQDE